MLTLFKISIGFCLGMTLGAILSRSSPAPMYVEYVWLIYAILCIGICVMIYYNFKNN
jgi:hypothetical protein